MVALRDTAWLKLDREIVLNVLLVSFATPDFGVVVLLIALFLV